MATSRTVSRRRRSTSAGVADLDAMVNSLLKENRTLKRQLAKLEAAGVIPGRPGRLSDPLTASVTTMRRKIERALQSSRPATRRRATTSRAGSRSSATTRTRKPSSPETQRKRLEALAKARAARATKKSQAEAAAG